VLAELRQIGVVSSESQVLFKNAALLPNGFALPTPQNRHGLKTQIETASEKIRNVKFLGHATGDNFTMGAVLMDLYHLIEQLSDSSFRI